MSEQTPEDPRSPDPVEPSEGRSTTESSTSNRPATEEPAPAADKVKEVGGRKGLDPVRYGDWEKGGRCIDF